MFKEKTQSRQLHFQSIKTRILALTLALLTTFTTLPSTTAYAEGSGTVSGDGNSQGTGGSIGGVVGYGSGGFAKVNQGYRFYMIDNNFNRVTDVYDFVFSVPNAGAILTNSRFESISYDTSHWHKYSIDTLANMAQGTQNASGIKSIYPLTFDDQITKKFYVHGSEFRQWFIGNGGGSVGTSHVDNTGGASSGGNAGSSNNGSTSGGSNSNKGNTATNPNYPNYNSLPEEFRGNVQKFTGLVMDVTPAVQNLINNAQTLSQQAKVKALYDERSTAYSLFLRNWNNEYSKYAPTATGDQVAKAAAGYIISYYSAKPGFTNAEARILGNYCYARYNGKPFTFPYNTKYSKFSNQSLLDQSIPLAGGQTYPAEAILSNREFVPTGFNKDITGDGTITGIDALKYQENNIYQYYLVVEPLLCIGVTNSSNGVIKRVYGSYYNIVQYWARYANNDNAIKINQSLMKRYGKQSLVVNKTYPGLSKIKPITSSSVALSSLTISQNLRLMEDGIGIGMHIYCASDLDDPSGTHTYDTLLGTTPGPAPDPSDLPQDSPDKGGNTITIIKNYVTEVNGTEQTDGNYIRKQNPHTIEIEDEPNYIVVDWNTSTGEVPDIPNGSKLPWNDLIKTSTKTQVGNSSTAVELSSLEKVLYVKLKKVEGSSRNPEVAGDWELNESELTKAVSSKQATIFFCIKFRQSYTKNIIQIHHFK